MTEDDGTQFCFRCKGMAVINKASLAGLPDLLNRAAMECYTSGWDRVYGPEDRDALTNLIDELRQAAIMIEGMPDA